MTSDNQADQTRPRATEEHLGFLLMRLALAVRAQTEARLTPLSLTPREFGLLNLIGVEPDLTQIQIAQRLEIDRTTMVAMIDRLEARGFAMRRQDADDRRVHRISLTAKGRSAHQRAVDAVAEVEQRFLKALSKDDSAELRRLLRRLLNAKES